ncbi:hypothetical protein P3S68_015509 [Capsicum galapagoense]
MRPFFIPHILRWHTSKNDKIIEGDPFKYNGKVIENVHPYIIPTVRKMKMDYMIMFEPYTDEVKNNILDGLKKELEGVTVLTSNEDSDDDEDLGGNPVGVHVGDDDSPSTSKDAAGTSSPGDLHKRVAVLEEAVLDIVTYIKEKKMKKKENDERQHERGMKKEKKRAKWMSWPLLWKKREKKRRKKNGEEDKSQEEGGKVAAAATEEEEAAADEQGGAKKGKIVEEEAEKTDKEEVKQEEAEKKVWKKRILKKQQLMYMLKKEGEEGENEETTAIVEKKEVEAIQTDVVMDIVDEINSNTCVDKELREKDI